MAGRQDPASLHECSVVESRQVGAYRLVSVVLPEIAAAVRPGQFLMVRKAGSSLDPLLPRPMGVHDTDADLVKLLIEPVGKGTRVLAETVVGDRLSVLGPLGNGFALNGGGGTALLIGGGIGISPLALLAKALKEKGREVRCLLGFKTRLQAVSAELFKGVEAELFTEDGTAGSKGMVSEPLSGYLAGLSKEAGAVEFFACGPGAMLEAVARLSKEHGITAQLSLAAHMACGVGACQGCVVGTVDGYKKVCSEGPVFAAEDIVWQ